MDYIEDVLLDLDVADPQPSSLFTLLEASDGRSVPLTRREVSAVVNTVLAVAEVQERLSFLPDSACNATFKFPLPPRAAVFRFQAKYGDSVLLTKVKRKAEAVSEYSTAAQQGHSAALLQQQAQSRLYEIKLGNLEAKQGCVVEFAYVQQLQSLAGALEFVHTATWVPPYVQAAGVREAEAGLEPSPTYTNKSTYGLSYHVDVTSSGSVKAVTSGSHNIDESVTIINKGATVTIRDNVASAKKDLQLLIELQEPSTEQGDAASGGSGTIHTQQAQRGPNLKTVALATFTPRLPEEGKGGARPKEVWLIVDGSGSMQGSPAQQAQQAAEFFVRDLPVNSGISFNLVVFGTCYRFMSDKVVTYNESSEATALAWIKQNVNGHWGGTEIHATLQAVCNVPVTEGRVRDIVFLTDGGISGAQRVYDLLAQHTDTRVHCMGIGHGAHRDLLEGIAERSGGVCAFVLDDKEIAAKCSYLKRAALTSGALTKVRLVTCNCMLALVPAVPPKWLLPKEPFRVLAEVLQTAPGAKLVLEARTASGQTVQIPVEVPAVDDGPPLENPLPGNAREVVEMQQGPVEGRQQGLGGSQGQGPNREGLAEEGPSMEEDDWEMVPKRQGPMPGEALLVLHAMGQIKGLLTGRSALHLLPDGRPVPHPPSQDVVKDEVVRVACAEGLVTPHTAAVGVLLRSSPADASQAAEAEVPLQVPEGRTLWAQPQPQPQPPMQHMRVRRGFFSGYSQQTARKMVKRLVPDSAVAFGPQSSGTGVAMAGVTPMSMDGAALGGGSVVTSMPAASATGLESSSSSPSMGALAAAPAPAFALFSAAPAPGAALFATASAQTASTSKDPQAMSVRDLVSELSSLRNTQGFWRPSARLQAVLLCKTAANRNSSNTADGTPDGTPDGTLESTGVSHDGKHSSPNSSETAADRHTGDSSTKVSDLGPRLNASRPKECEDNDIWATVLVLGFLSKHCASEQQLWSDMQSKAVLWLRSTAWGASSSVPVAVAVAGRSLV
ncbi:hypothetical protein ABBQ38_007471 [Trebouxia sp. C0009 RCD-2024]